LLLHIAESDKLCPPPAQQAITDALARHPQVTLCTYPNAAHAFARVGAAEYDAPAAQLAETRTAEFLRRHLVKA
jgi:carboxymethylenebutenolidase